MIAAGERLPGGRLVPDAPAVERARRILDVEEDQRERAATNGREHVTLDAERVAHLAGQTGGGGA